MNDNSYILKVVENARASLMHEGYPASAILVDHNGVVVAEKVNEAIPNNDPTAHGEIGCMREASKRFQTLDLSAFTLYTTIEPCLMCISACYWARVRRVVFAVRKEKLDKNNYEGGFSHSDMIEKFNRQIELVHGEAYEREAYELIEAWERKYRKDWQYTK